MNRNKLKPDFIIFKRRKERRKNKRVEGKREEEGKLFIKTIFLTETNAHLHWSLRRHLGSRSWKVRGLTLFLSSASSFFSRLCSEFTCYKYSHLKRLS